MDFETASTVSREIEGAHYPGLVVVGFRRQRWDDLASWALDVLNPRTGKMATVDEKDDWATRLTGIMDRKPAAQRRRAS